MMRNGRLIIERILLAGGRKINAGMALPIRLFPGPTLAKMPSGTFGG